ncbi:M23 family metallopeptidase [Streptomyces monticola]|uniref:M23 family metallopeptidase n=1 Tax=Streptomyces monticola TaxID=2666263 RepID=A0ABW2JMN9_9ACTN
MNDQHGHAAGYDGYSTGAFDTTSFDADPLFGTMPGADTAYDAGHSGQWDNGQWNGGQWSAGTHETYATGAHTTLGQDPYGQYETGAYDTTAMWATAGYQQLADIPAQPGPQSAEQWDATGQWQTQSFEQPTGLEHGQSLLETGAYDATAWNFDGSAATGATDTTGAYDTAGAYDAYDTTGSYDTTGAYETYGATAFDTPAFGTTVFEQPGGETPQAEPAQGEQPHADGRFSESEFAGASAPGDDGPFPDEADGAFAAAGPRGRSRRRAPAKRSALLTVAVPSVCALGVAGVAAASVAGGFGSDQGETTTQAAPDPGAVKPAAANNKLDTQLANLSADADDFADRASRTQERIDLKERQEAERKRKAAEAARKEAMRPKFALPVKQHGLSAYYGQAGINWMSVHSGIDFPVSYGTPVLAATDGTVRTQWNSAYGNMAIVTAPDGTETWYCHLSSTKIRSGSVKAGDTIAYSGNSGNSTGPHLHFEVRPGGGSAIDPLPWLRGHGLDPN